MEGWWGQVLTECQRNENPYLLSGRYCINIWTVKERLKQLLNRREKLSIFAKGRVSSAVLLPLYIWQGQCHIVFIKRTETVREHRGQISFPGGTCEDVDRTLLDTALRECSEEIGLCIEDVEILGELDDELTTTSNYIVSPFVAMIPWPYQFQMNKYEVDEIIEVPVQALLDKDCRQLGIEILNGQAVESYVYYYQGRVIWGATARILNRFLDIYTRVMPNR
jgi:8-oxo-dGTP pyrophosphatase MutT (NUDIX family)